MISTKKVYAEQILKLVLALSLLRADPENYLEWGLESRLAGTVGGWQLELRAAPLTDYPYANRKAVMPIIEDLVRYEHYSSSPIQAYLFTHSSVPSFNPETATSAGTNPSENQTVTSITISESASRNNTSTPIEPLPLHLGDVHADELFLNLEVFNEAASILEQNIADLTEYGEAAASNHIYQSLKEEPNDLGEPSLFDIFKCERPGSDCNEFGSFTAPSPDDDEGDNLGGVIEWDEYYGKKENIDESALAVKKQAERHEQNETETIRINDPVTAELTEEVRTKILNISTKKN